MKNLTILKEINQIVNSDLAEDLEKAIKPMKLGKLLPQKRKRIIKR